MGSNLVQDFPLLIIIALVVYWTFSNIRCILEDRLDLDIYINLWVLRPLELVISIAIFPTALVFLVVASYLRIMVLIWETAESIAAKVTSCTTVRALAYISLVLLIFFAANISIASVLRVLKTKSK
ncbi:hypothetical protein BsWGS_14937 [Bradybaena similaris]